jgi:hypothetical protein
MSLGWCYGHLGLNTAAVQQFRLAYAKSKRPDVACSLAHAELAEGNVTNARFLAAEVAGRTNELSSSFIPLFDDLQEMLSATAAGPDQSDQVFLDPSPEAEQPTRSWRRLARAVTRGCVVFAGGVFVVGLPILLWRSGTPQQVVQLVTLALAGGIFFGVTLLLCHAPILALARAAIGARLNTIHAVLLNGVLGLGSMIILVASLAAGPDTFRCSRNGVRSRVHPFRWR